MKRSSISREILSTIGADRARDNQHKCDSSSGSTLETEFDRSWI